MTHAIVAVAFCFLMLILLHNFVVDRSGWFRRRIKGWGFNISMMFVCTNKIVTHSCIEWKKYHKSCFFISQIRHKVWGQGIDLAAQCHFYQPSIPRCLQQVKQPTNQTANQLKIQPIYLPNRQMTNQPNKWPTCQTNKQPIILGSNSTFSDNSVSPILKITDCKFSGNLDITKWVHSIKCFGNPFDKSWYMKDNLNQVKVHFPVVQ